MLKFACCLLVIAIAAPAWCQVEPAASGGGVELDDVHMMTPPPVSRDAYPVIVGSESRSNYVDAGLIFTGSYIDNLMYGGNLGSKSDEAYYILPTVDFERRTPKHGESLHYSAGFTLYDHADQLNGVTQAASGQYRFHLSPYAAVELSDTFQQNDNLYNQANPSIGGGVSGAPGPSSNNVLLAPFAKQLNNSTVVGISDQYGKNAMIGASGSYSLYTFSDDAKNAGLNNEYTTSALAFYNRRIAPSEYVGVAYQFSKYITHPIDSYTVTNTMLGFYTHYFTKSFSLSVLGGPERYTAWSTTSLRKSAWTPAVQGSFGWQSLRASASASYSHIVAGAAGLVGTFRADLADLNGRLVLARGWSIGVDANYSMEKNISPVLVPGGHTIAGGVDLQHRLTDNLSVAIGYGHFHESYPGLSATTLTSPDSNRVYASVSYGLHRPLGR